jgi:hypothetical protein
LGTSFPPTKVAGELTQMAGSSVNKQMHEDAKRWRVAYRMWPFVTFTICPDQSGASFKTLLAFSVAALTTLKVLSSSNQRDWEVQPAKTFLHRSISRSAANVRATKSLAISLTSGSWAQLIFQNFDNLRRFQTHPLFSGCRTAPQVHPEE